MPHFIPVFFTIIFIEAFPIIHDNCITISYLQLCINQQSKITVLRLSNYSAVISNEFYSQLCSDDQVDPQFCSISSL